MHRGRKFSFNYIILSQRDDHTKLEARGRNISYDHIIRLHFAEKRREKDSENRERRSKGTREDCLFIQIPAWVSVHAYLFRYLLG